MPRDRTPTTNSGLGIDELAATTEKAYLAAAAPPVWTPPFEWDGWERMAVWALGYAEANAEADDAGRKFADLANEMWEIADGPPMVDAVAVEAACRHLFGSIEADPSEVRTIGQAEQSWAAWASARRPQPR